jgi:hypothetical protein
MIKDTIKSLGTLDIVLQDENGQLKEKLTVPNLVVQTGRNFISHRMLGSANTAMSHMSIGTGTTSPALTDIALETETFRNALTSSSVSAPGNAVVYVAVFDPSEPATANAITEAGIFNAASGGEILCRTTFPVINKGVLDTLTITWTIKSS